MAENKRLFLAVGIAVLAFAFGVVMYYLVLDESRVETVTPIEGAAAEGYPSPSGFEVLYRDGDDLCVLDLLDKSHNCHTMRDVPNLNLDSIYSPVAWSPDGKQVAGVDFTGESFNDPDIMLVDLKSWRVRDLTDDGYQGAVMIGSPGPSYDVDLQPAWSPDGEQIAFVRTTIGPDGQPANTSLMIVNVHSGVVRRVGPLPGHDQTDSGLKNIRALAWSPDGKQLAVSVLHLPLGDTQRDGLWLVDVADGKAEQVLTLNVVDQTVRDRYSKLELDDGFFSIMGIEWSPDNNQMLIRTGQNPLDITIMPLFLLDLKQNALSPLPLFDDEAIPLAAQVSSTMAAFSFDGSLLFVAYGLADDYSDPYDRLDPDDPANPTHALWISHVDNHSHEFLGHLRLEWRPRVEWGARDYILLSTYMLTIEGDQIGLFN